MKPDIQAVRPNDFVLYKQWGRYTINNSIHREKFGWPKLDTHYGRVKDVIDYKLNGMPCGTAIEFTDGSIRDIRDCAILFRGAPPVKETMVQYSDTNYPKYANIPFSY